jgi:polar amino acid transport system substrate-binding protein
MASPADLWRKRRFCFAWAAIGLLGACVFAACAPADTGDPASALLRVGYSQEPPYAFLDEQGRVTGEAPETVRIVLDQLGAEEVQWVRLDFDALLPNLLDGRVDIIASGLFVTPSRSARVRFTRPTVCTSPALVVRDDVAEEVRELQDPWQARGLTYVVLAESVEAHAARTLALPDERVLTVYDTRTAVDALQSGEADVLAITLPTARWILQTHADANLSVVGPYEPSEETAQVRGCSAFALRPDDTALAAAVDSALARFIGSSEHLSLIQRFGFDEAALPGSGAPISVAAGIYRVGEP